MKKKKILFVEDTEELRALLIQIFTRVYEVVTVANGSEALAAMNQGYRPDAIVTDLNMPGMDGKTFLRRLKDKESYQAIPVLVLSTRDKSHDRIELFKLGASDYLTKPFNPQELEIRLNRFFVKVFPENTILMTESKNKLPGMNP